jgi:hypothetical protein
MLTRTRLGNTNPAAAVWLGFSFLVCLILGLTILFPMRSPAALLIVAVTICLLGGLGISLVLSRIKSGRLSIRSTFSRSRLTIVLVLAGSLAYMGYKTLGPVTNYDSGLYHLGLIKYLGEYSTVPGLANLFAPFGYSSSVFPLGAFLGNGPWQGEGYRLFNGLVAVLVAVELSSRILRRIWSVGTFILIVAVACAWMPLIAIADFWIASPTADTAVMLLTFVACAYLADLLQSSHNEAVNVLVIGCLSLVLCTMRPTAIAFSVAAIALAVGSFLVRRSRSESESGARRRVSLTILATLASLLVSIQIVRDYITSGWFLYPLSYFKFNVNWAAPNPAGLRAATLAHARDFTSLDGSHTATSWDWIPVWTGRLGGYWESYFVLCLVSIAVILLVLTVTTSQSRVSLRRMALAMVPSIIAVIAWFTVSPPSYRFIWGPLFSLGIIPIGYFLYALASSRRARIFTSGRVQTLTLVLASVLMLLVAGYSAAARNQWDSYTSTISFKIGEFTIATPSAPITHRDVTWATSEGGMRYLTPDESDQCWDAYPLCTFAPIPSLRMRGNDISDGFQH